MGTFSGILAASSSPLLMCCGFVLYESWSGSAFSLNLYKACLASLFFTLTILASTMASYSGDPSHFLSASTVDSALWLSLSGFIGIVIGDACWLQALADIGAVRVILVDTIKPFCAAGCGWAFFGEELRPSGWVGLVLTAGGILGASLERENAKVREKKEEEAVELVMGQEGVKGEEKKGEAFLEEGREAKPVLLASSYAAEEEGGGGGGGGDDKRRSSSSSSRVALGYAYAALNVIFDTYGSVLTRQHGENLTAWEINLLRFGSSGVIMLLMSAATCLYLLRGRGGGGDGGEKKRAKRGGEEKKEEITWHLFPTMDRAQVAKISLGVLLVTFCCSGLSNYALFQIPLALSLTLGSIGPLYAIPVVFVLRGERTSPRGCFGALVAVSGVALLCSDW